MVRVFAARRDQFAVDAVFDDLAVFEDDDPVEACDRGEAVVLRAGGLRVQLLQLLKYVVDDQDIDA